MDWLDSAAELDELDFEWLKSRPGQKWAAARQAGHDVLACWVADMDFPAPPPVRHALEQLGRGGDLRYPELDESQALEPVFLARQEARFGWAPEPGKLRAFCDVIQAVEAVLHVSSGAGDGVLLFTPAYPPFLEGIAAMGRRLAPVPAVGSGDGWEFDLDMAKREAVDARALLLVNPHNPTGRMLSEGELVSVAELAARHDLVVISDEIHADLSLAERRHIPFASLGPEVGARTVTLTSASKSHNLGGMRCAVAHLGNHAVESALAALPAPLFGRVSIAAVAATLAAWSPEGDGWLSLALSRLRRNRETIGAWLSSDGAGGRAGVEGHVPEATYLCWLDFRGTSIGSTTDPADALLEVGRVLLARGPDFGPGGKGFARLNFATSASVLEEILNRIATALKAL